jgi:hypothetical protein
VRDAATLEERSRVPASGGDHFAGLKAVGESVTHPGSISTTM